MKNRIWLYDYRNFVLKYLKAELTFFVYLSIQKWSKDLVINIALLSLHHLCSEKVYIFLQSLCDRHYPNYCTDVNYSLQQFYEGGADVIPSSKLRHIKVK